ncbi:Afadin and alpha-actinin-binding-domain-containing protein [Hypoxylon cercidicola]|nr:Afadin and alpha-actinin-binding-domain-containing protein [Hypoxylon cercidicola]
MVDPDNLRTASLYINNQLLSRGLLRDGHNIDFANPEVGDGGLQGTMGKVMSVINDLILRRDRDAENRESLSTTLRTLRADSQRQTTEFARQTEKLADTQRKLDISESTERSLRTQLKTAEQNNHRLKDEAVKTKTLLTQARAACANEIRKRDRQIDGLKKAVTDASRVRGGNRSRDVLSISVTGEVGGDEHGLPPGATQDEGYSLRLETNEFLTQLARGLSEENEGLLALFRRTVDALRDMSGLERGAESVDGGQVGHHPNNDNGDVVVVAPQKGADELAAELEAIMEHLRTILTNPSFVPIEEVEIREEAINRLRAGLETMESRWKDAVHMIDGWRKRMVSSGKSVDMEDLQMGLRLSPVRVRDVEETSDVVPIPMRLPGIQEEEEEHEEDDEYEAVDLCKQEQEEPELELRRPRSPSPVESLHLVPAPGYEVEENDDLDSDSSSIFQDDIDIDELDTEEPNVQVLQESTYSTSMDSPPLPVPPKISPLKDSYSSGNRGVTIRERDDHAYHKRPGDFTTIMEENTRDLAMEEEERAPTPPPHVIRLNQSPKQQKTGPSKRSPQWQDQQNRPSSTASYDSPLFGRSGERPSQSDPSRKLFSKPVSGVGQQVQTKSQPEPSGKTQTFKSKRPESSRGSPDPMASDIKRPGSSPVILPSQTSSTSRAQAPASATQSRPTSSSSLKQTTTTTAPQQPSIPRPRSPVRTANQIAAANSRLPRPNSSNNPPPQSPLTMATIAAKLAASEREADAARVRAKLRAVRNGRRGGNTVKLLAPANSPPEDRKAAAAETKAGSRRDEDVYASSVDPVKKDLPPPAAAAAPQEPPAVPVQVAAEGKDEAADELARSIGGEEQQQQQQEKQNDGIRNVKRRRDRGERRTSKVASRRRSTLSPWELETLIQGNGSGTPAK